MTHDTHNIQIYVPNGMGWAEKKIYMWVHADADSIIRFALICVCDFLNVEWDAPRLGIGMLTRSKRWNDKECEYVCCVCMSGHAIGEASRASTYEQTKIEAFNHCCYESSAYFYFFFSNEFSSLPKKKLPKYSIWFHFNFLISSLRTACEECRWVAQRRNLSQTMAGSYLAHGNEDTRIRWFQKLPHAITVVYMNT